MRKLLIILLVASMTDAVGQYKTATVRESEKVFPTYDFSDPNPIPEPGRIYPYFRFDGYTHAPQDKRWKIVELENDFIKIMILPEVGGKIWTAWDKASGKPFLYYNQVVKFRNVAMRGPWTSGGIEANYGIIGHTPNCATPVDYLTETKEDGSVSCYIGTLDLLTQTYWTIEINLPRDKAYFTTRSFWSNDTPLEQPYYTWMNVGMPSSGNLEFVYPGNYRIGHEGEPDAWKIDEENGRDMSFYDNNDYGGSKSFHILGKHAEFFGAFYHDEDFGMARYSLRDDKVGRKVWMWGLSRQGMIWEDLLTDNDGQYVEIQSGRLFSQASTGSNRTPFNQKGFEPHTTDAWTEYWYPVKGTKGFVEANQYGALNVRTDRETVHLDFMALEELQETLTVTNAGKVVYSKDLRLQPLENFHDTFSFGGNTDGLTISIGDNKLVHKLDPKAGLLSRPVEAPDDFDWNSAYGLHIQGKELLQQRLYPRAQEFFRQALEKESHYLPALADMAMIAYRNLDYAKALEYATHALRIDTYHPQANFYYGLAHDALGNTTDAKDGFEIASLNASIRGAAWTELARIYFRERNFDRARHYAQRAVDVNNANTAALQMLAVLSRLEDNRQEADKILAQLGSFSPLNHFIRFEAWRHDNTAGKRDAFTRYIRNELPFETYIALSDWYGSIGQGDDAIEVLKLSPAHALVSYHLAWRSEQQKPGSGKAHLEKANSMSPDFVLPFHGTTAEALTWAIEQSESWKPRYYLGLIRWSREDVEAARKLFTSAGDPAYAPFYAARAELFDNDHYARDVRKASQLDPQQWRYGRMLGEHFLDKGANDEALKVVSTYHKRFPGDFRLDMLMARALLANKQYKATTDLLGKTQILPYEGATEGRQMYREAWLMQAVAHVRSKKYKPALASLEKSKLWPENLGVGKPYDDRIDLRLENFLEALVYEKMNRKADAARKYREIIAAESSRRNPANKLFTALALRRTDKTAEGEALLREWKEQAPSDAWADWAYAVYQGQNPQPPADDNANARLVQEITSLAR